MIRIFILTILLTSFSFKIYCHHKIYSPVVEEGRQSLEWRGHLNVDDREKVNKSHHHVFETEYSWTNYWQSELEFHVSDKEDTSLNWEKTEFQNQLQVFDKKNFAGALYFSYNFVSEGKKADELEYKYLNEFMNDKYKFTSNFIFEKEIGGHAQGSTKFEISNRIMFMDPLDIDFDFGILGFSDLGYLTKMNTFHNQEHLYGLQVDKEFQLNGFEYEISLGYLHGLTNASANHMFLWNMEFEF